MLERVSLTAGYANRFPDQLSGGERQRVAIARALICEPSVLICDEVTSALDVSVQAAIVELLHSLQRDLGLSMLFVTHNLPLVRSIAQRIAVMSHGRIVELGQQHPEARETVGVVEPQGGGGEFEAALRRENHTLKRALTDPRLFSGIGNAYSDEILHRAKLSPALLTQKMSADDVRGLFESTRAVLSDWTDRLRAEARDRFPERVTAFRDDMAVHGKFGKPCPVCGAPVQRIRYADNETNYCARCQTDGKLLADRALSRLLKQDWPRSIDELTWS